TFLTKELVGNNPNIDKYPIIDWSNNQIIRFMKERNEFKNKIKNEVENNKFVKFNYEIDEQIFAFQQIDNNSYRAINDKDIYNSIITSIKALEYERNALNIRINRDALYNFNILSVFDGEMYSLKYNGESEPEIKRRENIKYL